MLLCLLLSFCMLNRFSLAADTTTGKNAASSPAKPVRIACVGDSITFGAGLKDRDHDSYPAWLGRWLGDGWNVRNFGVNGATMLTKSDLPYVKQKAHDEALAFKPDVVIIMLGTNDSKHRGDGSLDSDNAPMNWESKADYVPDYEALIAEFRKANPAVKFYLCYPTPCFPGRWGINDKTIHDEVIPLIRKVARKSHAKTIDFYKAFSEKKEFFPDTVHPNEAGAKLMAVTAYHALTGKKPPENP